MESKITEKIQQLLAMAEHPNSNENEAAIALEKAQELLLRHNLTRADVMTGGPEATPAGIGKLDRTETDGYVWKRFLVSVLADANLCKVIGSPSEKTWHLFGAYDNVRAVLEMYNWITLQLVFMANREFRAYKNDEGTERGQTWKAGYYQGAILSIKKRLDKPLEEFAQGPGHALVIQNKADLSTAVHKIFPRLSNRRSYASSSRDGVSSGRDAGRGMSLSPQRKIGATLSLGSGR